MKYLKITALSLFLHCLVQQHVGMEIIRAIATELHLLCSKEENHLVYYGKIDNRKWQVQYQLDSNVGVETGFENRLALNKIPCPSSSLPHSPLPGKKLKKKKKKKTGVKV